MHKFGKILFYRTKMFAQHNRTPFAALSTCTPELSMTTWRKKGGKPEYKTYFGMKWKQGLLFKNQIMQESWQQRPSLTCTAEPPRSQPWLGWSRGGKRSDSRSCNIPGQSLPEVHPCAESPLCTWLSPGDSQCGCKQTAQVYSHFTAKSHLVLIISY